jgi:hypothetical protein
MSPQTVIPVIPAQAGIQASSRALDFIVVS